MAGLSADSATLEFSWHEDNFHSTVVAPIPHSRTKWHVEHPADDPHAHGVGNVVSHWLDSFPNTCTDIRWYTDAVWHGSHAGQSTRL